MEAVFGFFAERFDLPVLDWIAANLRCSFLDAVMPVITRLGDAGIFWILLSAVLLFFPKYRRTGLGMVFALLLGLVVCNITMKPLLARIRPYDYQQAHFGNTVTLLIPALHDYSFPSGHTLASFEAATVLMRGSKRLGIPALCLACLIAFSRLYLYVHYPTDVLFSLGLGVCFGVLGSRLAQKAGAWYQRKRPAK